MRILGVDHGEKRIGIALSDTGAVIASPLTVVQHRSRTLDAAQVASLAREHEVRLIVVGQSFDERGRPNPAGRSAARFAEALQAQTEVPVITWDEAFSTSDARARQAALGASRSRRAGHLDDVAAAVLLQSYLDAHAVDP